MYGPRTTCIVINSDKKCVQELTLKSIYIIKLNIYLLSYDKFYF